MAFILTWDKDAASSSPHILAVDSGYIMRRHKYFFTILLSLTIGTSFAHKDFFVHQEYGNVKVSIKTGYKYEEIQKAFMIGELTKNLLKELKYADTVFLDFNHAYTNYCKPDFFISYDNGSIIYNSFRENSEINSKRKWLVVRQVSKTFDIISTLILVEFAVRNRSEVELKQKPMAYSENFCDWTVNSIDVSEIMNQLSKPISKKLKKVLKNITVRPETEKLDSTNSRITYYFRNNKFNIALINGKRLEKPILELDNIYDFRRIDNSSAIVFDTDHSFYFTSTNKHQISKRHVINNMSLFYSPFELKFKETNKIIMLFYSNDGIKLIAYQIDTDSFTEKTKNYNEK